MMTPFFSWQTPPPTLPGGQTLNVSNPFWSEVIERWKAILKNVPPNWLLPFSNICNPSLKIKNYKYIPLLSLVDANFNILPPSQLRERLPLADWKKISAPLLNLITAKVRENCKQITNFTGNYGPFIHPLLQISSPNIKGCKEFSKLISTETFEEGAWSNFAKFSTTHEIPPIRLDKQIVKLARTSKLIEARDLQFLVQPAFGSLDSRSRFVPPSLSLSETL